MKKYQAVSLFSGIGGICKGLINNGIEVIWANDNNKEACITYKANHPNTQIVEKNIEDISISEVPKVDILTSGFPCTSFSIAGHKKGFKDAKTGHLFFETLRILKGISPEIFILENVKHLVNHDKGKTFEIIKESLKEAGYYFKYKVLNTSKYANIPQNRERVFIVGFKDKKISDNFSFPEPIFLSKTIGDLIDINDKKDDKYYYENTRHYPLLKKSIVKKNTIYKLRRSYVIENKKGLCPTLTANMGTGGNNVPIILDNFGIRKLTPKECFAFQGFDDSFIIPENMANSHLYKQAGNSVTVGVVDRIVKNILKAINGTN